MRYHGAYHLPDGKIAVSEESKDIASLSDRWSMLRIFWYMTKVAPPKLRLKGLRIVAGYMVDPRSKAYYYKVVDKDTP